MASRRRASLATKDPKTFATYSTFNSLTGTELNTLGESPNLMYLGSSLNESTAKKTMSGFAIQFSIMNGQSSQLVTIPVVDDRMEVSKATLPNGYKLLNIGQN